MARKITFEVHGEQAPCGSKKGYPRGRRVIIVDANKNAPKWKAIVAEAARKAAKKVLAAGEFLQGPLSMSITFQRKRPRGHLTKKGLPSSQWREYPSVTPDTTKLIRGTEDAMTEIIYKDDAQIVSQRAYKVYGDEYLTKISVEEMCANGSPASTETPPTGSAASTPKMAGSKRIAKPAKSRTTKAMSTK